MTVFVAADLPELDEPLPAARADPDESLRRLDTPRPQHPLARGEVALRRRADRAVVGPDPYRRPTRPSSSASSTSRWAAVVDAEAAMRAGSPEVHDGASNVVGRVSKVIGDVDRAFAEAEVVVEDHPAHGRVSSMAIETRGLCAQFDAATQSLTVWAPHQAPYHLRGAVAARVGLPVESVRVIAPDTGGGFGPKEGIYPEDVLVPLLAVRLGRPVKWIQTRAEFVACTHQAREQAHHARLAATRDGRILGLDVRIVKDVGAYHCFSVHEPTNTINHLPSQYKVPAFRAEGFSVVTNKVPSAPYRGAGRPGGDSRDRAAARSARREARARSRRGAGEEPDRPGGDAVSARARLPRRRARELRRRRLSARASARARPARLRRLAQAPGASCALRAAGSVSASRAISRRAAASVPASGPR